MSESKKTKITSVEELLAAQKKEKKEVIAKTQKMKHSVPKGDKKKKKEVTAEIAQMLADVDSKHEREMQEFEGSLSSTEKSGSSKDNVKNIELATSDIEIVSDVVKDVVEDASKQASDITEGDKSIKEGGNAVKEGRDVLKKSSDVSKESSDVLKESSDFLKESSDVIVEGRNIAEELNPIEESADIVIKEGDITKEEGEISKEGVSEKNIKVESVVKRRKITVLPSASATTSPSDSPAKEDKPVEKGVNVPMQRISKAQKRRNKKAMLEKERQKAIEEQEIENLKGLRHVESVEIIKKLSQRNLTIYEIPSDGHCLYKAIEHQLSVMSSKETTVEALRQATSEYMLTHIQDYIPFLTHPETGDILTEKQYAQYCEDIVKTPAWGGQVEIQVLSHVLGHPIEVVQAQGPSIISGEGNIKKLILSYHRHAYGLGEHYNSVIPKTAKK